MLIRFAPSPFSFSFFFYPLPLTRMYTQYTCLDTAWRPHEQPHIHKRKSQKKKRRKTRCEVVLRISFPLLLSFIVSWVSFIYLFIFNECFEREGLFLSILLRVRFFVGSFLLSFLPSSSFFLFFFFFCWRSRFIFELFSFRFFLLLCRLNNDYCDLVSAELRLFWYCSFFLFFNRRQLWFSLKELA